MWYRAAVLTSADREWLASEFIGIRYAIHDLRRAVAQLQRMEMYEMADLSRIQQSVTDMGDAEAGAAALLGELSGLIRASATDPAALAALADQIDAEKSDLAAAVVANTPASTA